MRDSIEGLPFKPTNQGNATDAHYQSSSTQGSHSTSQQGNGAQYIPPGYTVPQVADIQRAPLPSGASNQPPAGMQLGPPGPRGEPRGAPRGPPRGVLRNSGAVTTPTPTAAGGGN